MKNIIGRVVFEELDSSLDIFRDSVYRKNTCPYQERVCEEQFDENECISCLKSYDKLMRNSK